MKSIFPILNQAVYTNGSPTTITGAVPTVNTWDITSNPLSFAISVPQGERWLTHIHAESWIAGPNIPTYQTSFGIVLRGATIFSPVQWGGPGSYWHSITAQNDAAWGSCSIDLWLNPGITVVNFGYMRDAGAVSMMRRLINAYPFLGAKV